MRTAFINTLIDLARDDQRIFLLTGDLGFTILEPFAEKFPKRFINTGVAEQNMIGVATGLAKSGYIPFVYSLIPFAVLRPYEFIRNGPIYHNLPVRIVGVGGGFEYGHSGKTHFGLEDIALMRVQTALTIVAPADHNQVVRALKSTWNLNRPIYYRLGKDAMLPVPGLNGKFRLGKIQLISKGKKALFITLGPIAAEVSQAADKLTQRKIDCTVAVVSSFNPSPKADLVKLIRQFPEIFVVETHYRDGGLGSMVCEIVAENNLNCRVTRLGIKDLKEGTLGSQKFLEQRYGLTSSRLVSLVAGRIKE